MINNKNIAKKKWLVHYRNRCIGCGNCPLIAPKYWQMNTKDGKANLILGEKTRGIFKRKLDQEDITINEQVAKQCPVGIIKVL